MASPIHIRSLVAFDLSRLYPINFATSGSYSWGRAEE
jgi:hypothetical protein